MGAPAGLPGVALHLTGLAIIFGWWPPVVVAVVLAGAYCRARIYREEAINPGGITGYRKYMLRMRWRMVSGGW